MDVYYQTNPNLPVTDRQTTLTWVITKDPFFWSLIVSNRNDLGLRSTLHKARAIYPKSSINNVKMKWTGRG